MEQSRVSDQHNETEGTGACRRHNLREPQSKGKTHLLISRLTKEDQRPRSNHRFIAPRACEWGHKGTSVTLTKLLDPGQWGSWAPRAKEEINPVRLLKDSVGRSSLLSPITSHMILEQTAVTIFKMSNNCKVFNRGSMCRNCK